MAVKGIKRKNIGFSLPLPAYENLQKLAGKEGISVPGYVKRLILQDLYHKGLSQYFRMEDVEQQEL